MAEGLRKKVAALHDAGELEGIIAINALSEVQRCDTIFYSINPGGHSIRLNEISLKGQPDLASLANETRGTAFVSDENSDLDEVFGKIAAELPGPVSPQL